MEAPTYSIGIFKVTKDNDDTIVRALKVNDTIKYDGNDATIKNIEITADIKDNTGNITSPDKVLDLTKITGGKKTHRKNGGKKTHRKRGGKKASRRQRK